MVPAEVELMPQHSVAVRHSSSSGRQPPRNWQILKPVPSSAQIPLQQSESDWQALPTTRQLPPTGGSAQTPLVPQV